jgi:hypothetical protein
MLWIESCMFTVTFFTRETLLLHVLYDALRHVSCLDAHLQVLTHFHTLLLCCVYWVIFFLIKLQLQCLLHFLKLSVKLQNYIILKFLYLVFKIKISYV